MYNLLKGVVYSHSQMEFSRLSPENLPKFDNQHPFWGGGGWVYPGGGRGLMHFMG